MGVNFNNQTLLKIKNLITFQESVIPKVFQKLGQDCVKAPAAKVPASGSILRT